MKEQTTSQQKDIRILNQSTGRPTGISIQNTQDIEEKLIDFEETEKMNWYDELKTIPVGTVTAIGANSENSTTSTDTP